MFVLTPTIKCSLSHWRRSSFVPYFTSSQHINCPVLKPELSTAKSDSIDLSGAALNVISSFNGLPAGLAIYGTPFLPTAQGKYLASDHQETASPVLPFVSVPRPAFRLAVHPTQQRPLSHRSWQTFQVYTEIGTEISIFSSAKTPCTKIGSVSLRSHCPAPKQSVIICKIRPRQIQECS
jgi:hypothetical protein